MVKSVDIEEWTERYCECPYCGITISDFENIDEFPAEGTFKCPDCKKTIRISK